MDKIRVLVVDDSALMRKMLSDILAADPQIEVAGTASDGGFALRKMAKLDPEVVTLDLEMPNMNGIQTLKALVRDYSVPVIMVSAHTAEGAEQTLEALDLGAVDFVHKPDGGDAKTIAGIAGDLHKKVRAIGREYRRRRASGPAPTAPATMPTAPAPAPPPPSRRPEAAPVKSAVVRVGPRRTPLEPRLVVIGTSTGGPNALTQVMPCFPADFHLPVVIVQHMPAGFTKSLAERLHGLNRIAVKEAQEGDLLKPGRALMAPGGMQLQIEKRNGVGLVSIHPATKFQGTEHAPSVNVMFRSALEAYGGHIAAGLMTGMGADGAQAMKEIYDAGGFCVVQDEASSVVYGMPKAALDLGAVDLVASVDLIGDELVKYCTSE